MELWVILSLVWLHFFADFVLQTDKIALNKSNDNEILLQHVAIYAFCFSVILLYLGCVTTSINAGSPFATISTARFSAGPRSFGSVIGPSPCTPMLFARFA